MESVLKLGPFQILFLLILFLAGCDTQQTSEEDSSLDGLGSAGVEITAPFSSSSTTEKGGTVSTKIRLKSAPLSPVTINLKSSDTTEGSVSPSVLIFNKDNWDSYVSITATGQDDEDADGPQSFEVQIESIVSDDPKYSALSGQVDPIKLQNEDDEIAAIILGTLSGNTSESSGGTGTFTVKLSSKPLETVTIPITTTDTTEGIVSAIDNVSESVSSVSLRFDPDNSSGLIWSSAQTVTITGQDDSERDGDIGYQIKIGPSDSSSPPYKNVAAPSYSITNTDNETSGVTVDLITSIDCDGNNASISENLTTCENGSTATFTVKLDTKPSADVTINLRSTDPGEAIINV
ncbi:MAG: hypothetical protein CL934_14120, partial [Deltaproteobacteria bacterium]|nr:hypothetical protein [Deltaproteobacteria bacterium]